RDLTSYAIYVMNRGNRPLKLEGVTEIVCDRHDAAALRKMVPPLEWHAIVDFCAYEPSDVAILLQNLPGSVQQYINISTASVYQNSLLLPMKEDTRKVTGPLPGPHGDYAYKKWLTEMQLREICEARGIAHISLRPPFVYGKYNYAPRESYFFNLIASNEPIIVPSPPQALFSMVSVWDLARICIACLGNEKVFNNAYTVCSEELVSYDRLIEVLETIAPRKFNVQRQPVRVIEARGIPLPFPLEEHLVYSGSLLQKTLNYRYMSFQEGMTRTYNWFLKVNGQ
ncbi:MAG: NAD-dependent epimerase/dehydratase family protein, partial [Dehalococcoidia bacterium]|nr:NAD-dependent epimerase/dehydratase family protein [Dehalococcoidia bacterium]